MKTYLGDGAYAEYDGYGITLTTSNGLRDTNTIVMEPEVVGSFLEFIEAVKFSNRETAKLATKEELGFCCMAAHAQAIPPWTCPCICHAHAKI